MEIFLRHLEEISLYVHQFRFHYFSIGPLCNGRKSVEFTDADCDLARKSYLPKTPGVHVAPQATYIFVKFVDLFQKGFDVIRKLNEDPNRFKDLDIVEQKAFEDLFQFFERRDNIYAKLSKLLKNGSGSEDKVVETELTAALTVHLLQELAPDESFVIDNHSKDKEKFSNCKCGCHKDVRYGDTGMGHEQVWHGYMDIVCGNPCGLIVGVVSSEKARKNAEVSEAQENDEPSPKKAKIEDDADTMMLTGKEKEKSIHASYKSRTAVVNRTTAQTIVFSLLQKQKTYLNNYLIPSVLITPTSFRITMYDADNDILIRSASNLFHDGDTFSEPSILILWMVLHYKLFCSGFPEDLSASDLDYLKSGFKENVCNDIYLHELKSCMGSFPAVEQEIVVDDDAYFKLGVEYPFPMLRRLSS